MNARPILVITMGDPAGIGPEVVVKALGHPELYEILRPVVVGDARRLAQAAAVVGSSTPMRRVRVLSELAADGSPDLPESSLGVIDLANVEPDLPLGKVSAAAGRAAYDYIERAVRLALSGEAAAVVTGPLNKEALAAAGLKHAGHTEILADLCGVRGTVMMLVAGALRVSHVSTHISLRQAIERMTVERILHVVRLTHAAVVPLLATPSAPRIALAGLNPHAGESGLFGSEEQEIIGPAVSQAREQGYDVRGPVAPDTIFYRALRGEFDAVVAMYHDQGHIPVKLAGFADGVNVTLGLPIIRTSVDHGTAFDIVGTGRADERSMLAALRLAAQMAAQRNANG
jgi:4-phospho-D-threonate 3-dehydrogenase / 4-phospho-D-erythronate 3-dehydrogenase